jgi:hypothetical protein
MKSPGFCSAIVLSLLLPQAASPQDFTSIDKDLSALESLIQGIIMIFRG